MSIVAAVVITAFEMLVVAMALAIFSHEAVYSMHVAMLAMSLTMYRYSPDSTGEGTKGDPRGLGQDKGSGGLWNNSKGAPGKDPSKKMDKPFGEWNTFKIRMIGERVTVGFNGETVVDNCVLENFFANKKAGYIAYGKQPVKDAKAETKVPNGFMRDPAFPKGRSPWHIEH